MSNFLKNKKSILVTGGCGFIGTNFINQLIHTSDCKIFNIDKEAFLNDFDAQKDLNYPKDKFFHFKEDLKNFKNIYNLLFIAKPDIIFHFAAESHVDRSIDTPSIFVESNVVGTFNLLESSRKYFDTLDCQQKRDFRFVHISTDEVFGSINKGKFDERTKYDPRSPYSATKASSDHLVNSYFHTYGLPTVITNCSNNYGPYQYPEKLIPLTINNCINNKNIPLYGNGENIRDWLYVEDHIEAILLAAKYAKPGSNYCIGGDNEMKNIEVINHICNLMDNYLPQKTSYKNLITFVKDRPGHDKRYSVNSHLIQKELGWERKWKFADGINKTVKWYLNSQDWCEKTNV